MAHFNNLPIFFSPSSSPTFQSICAKAGGEPCCDWVGEDGAGHYVKMVHNGIEYGDMQLICEAYHLMKDALGMTCDEMSEVSGGYGGVVVLVSLVLVSLVMCCF